MKDNDAPAGILIAAETARRFAADAFVKAGLPAADAGRVAELMIEADLGSMPFDVGNRRIDESGSQSVAGDEWPTCTAPFRQRLAHDCARQRRGGSRRIRVEGSKKDRP